MKKLPQDVRKNIGGQVKADKKIENVGSYLANEYDEDHFNVLTTKGEKGDKGNLIYSPAFASKMVDMLVRTNPNIVLPVMCSEFHTNLIPKLWVCSQTILLPYK